MLRRWTRWGLQWRQAPANECELWLGASTPSQSDESFQEMKKITHPPHNSQRERWSLHDYLFIRLLYFHFKSKSFSFPLNSSKFPDKFSRTDIEGKKTKIRGTAKMFFWHLPTQKDINRKVKHSEWRWVPSHSHRPQIFGDFHWIYEIIVDGSSSQKTRTSLTDLRNCFLEKFSGEIREDLKPDSNYAGKRQNAEISFNYLKCST